MRGVALRELGYGTPVRPRFTLGSPVGVLFMGFYVIVPSCVGNVGSPAFNSVLCPANSVAALVCAEPIFISLDRRTSIMQERLLGKEGGYIRLLGGVFRMLGRRVYEATGGCTSLFITGVSCRVAPETDKAEKVAPS